MYIIVRAKCENNVVEILLKLWLEQGENIFVFTSTGQRRWISVMFCRADCLEQDIQQNVETGERFDAARGGYIKKAIWSTK